MAQIKYDAYVKRGAEREAQNNQNQRANYFFLKNDKDEAIVRIMHDSTDDFDMLLVHPVSVQGKQRNVNCLRSPEDPISKCPFCEANKPLKSKMYIHMIQYTKNADGTVTATPVIWDRSASYATEIASKIETYGPLSDSIFKIKRNGAAGSMTTSYSIDYAPPAIYNPEIYKKDVSLVAGLKALGTAVMDKNEEQMKEMLQPGNPDTKQVSEPVPPPTPPTYQPTQNYNQNYQSPPQAPNFNSNSETEVVRPRRYY